MEYKKVRKMSGLEAAYLAGLIDGEGTVTLTKREKNAQRAITITIANTERELLEYPMRVISAGIISSKRTQKIHHTPSFVYRITGRQALSVLQQIVPYLHSYKKQRAKFVLAEYINITPRNGRYNQDLLERKKIFDERFFQITAKQTTPSK